MTGYIKLFRNITSWSWYKDGNTCRLFIHLLLKANWTDEIFRGDPVPRGSFVSTYKELAFETGLSEKNVRTALEHLKRTGEVAVCRRSKNTVFTIKNYCHYQSGGTITGSQNGTETTVSRQQLKKRRNKRIKENIYACACACARKGQSTGFTNFRERDYNFDVLEDLLLQSQERSNYEN